jgi:succinate dehydrogenase/fumarate reductase cytochrome b subunit
LNFLDEISWPLLAWAGMMAYVMSNWTLMLLRKLNATRYLPRAYWSCLITGGAGDFSLVLAGFVRFLIMITLFPLAYALIFARLGRAEALTGALVGLCHGILGIVMLPLAARRCASAHPPGLGGWRLGRATPVVLMFVFAIYGALIGYIYVLPNG